MLAGGIGQRRIKVTTPDGTVTSTVATGFTVSATPTVNLDPDVTFLGGGYNITGDLYTAANGALVINGTNLRGVKQLEFKTGVTSNGIFAVDAAAGNPNYVFNAAGTTLTILAAALPAGFTATGGTKTVELLAAHSVVAVPTPAINTP